MRRDIWRSLYVVEHIMVLGMFRERGGYRQFNDFRNARTKHNAQLAGLSLWSLKVYGLKCHSSADVDEVADHGYARMNILPVLCCRWFQDVGVRGGVEAWGKRRLVKGRTILLLLPHSSIQN